MCGIAGRFHPQALAPAPGWSERASQLLAHRGPDGSGRFFDERCELVHRRLALLDLSPTGAQPMANEDGTVQVVFNGEIYNHHELRRDLKSRGHVFRGTSDTEVLVHLYEEVGAGLVERLRGIFAFAIYDHRNRRLLLARDRFGVKPLYYTLSARGEWAFASEMKALVVLPGFTPEIDRQACYDFLGLGFVPGNATGFRNIASLGKGTVMLVSPDGAHVSHFGRIRAAPDATRSIGAAVDACADRLLDAVDKQSEADVPVAALLSGGVDSSLVVAARQRTRRDATQTFSVRFPDAQYDESDVARTVASHCGTTHHTIDPTERALTPETILDLFRHFDQPFADTSLLPTFWVASAIRERGIICALSGDGGDEGFGGYARFWRANQLVHLMRSPQWVSQAGRAIGGALSAVTRDAGRQIRKAADLADAGRVDTAALLSGLSTYLTEGEKAHLIAPDARDGLLPGARLFDSYQPTQTNDLDEVSRRMTETMFAITLPSDMLRKVDMMSMRASVEVRVPLLDESVVELGLSLPHRLKTDGRKGKLVLRELARRWLPESVARHPKHGFAIPLDAMASPRLHEALRDLLTMADARTRPLANAALVDGWLQAFAGHRAQGTGHGDRNGSPFPFPHSLSGSPSRGGLTQRVFTMLSLEMWMRDHQLRW